MESHVFTVQSSAAKIAGGHGYRIEGDVAILNADLAVVSPEATSARWALQLWACHQPHLGGPLSGTKVAEAPVDLSGAQPGQSRHLEAEAPARLPVDRGGHAMVLVLAAEAGGAFEQVHDFANFPERQPFLVPHFEGEVSYAIEGAAVVLRAAEIRNPRAADNLSGSLSLELRATAAPWDDAAAAAEAGVVLAIAPLGRLSGQSAHEAVERRVAFAPPPAGEWRLVLTLREWTSGGAVTRDACAFPAPYVVRAPEPALAPEPAPLPSLPPAEPTVSAEPPPVSIQTASVEELARVKGLTRKLALEIIRARPFRSLDELVRVRGIGEKTARKLRGLLTV